MPPLGTLAGYDATLARPSGARSNPAISSPGAAPFVEPSVPPQTAANSIAMEPPPNRTGFLIVLGLMMFGIAGATYYFVVHESQPVVVSAEALPSAPPPPAPKPAEPAVVTVQVKSDPPGAEIREGEAILGHTPADVKVARGKTRSLQLMMDGREPETVEVSAERTEYAVALARVEVPDPPKNRWRNRPKPRHRPEPPKTPDPKPEPPKKDPVTPPIPPKPEPPKSKPEPEPPDEPEAQVAELKIEAWTTAGRELPARVTIDGKTVPKRTPMTIKLRAGKRTVKIAAPGYSVRTRVVDVVGGKMTDLQVIVDL